MYRWSFVTRWQCRAKTKASPQHSVFTKIAISGSDRRGYFSGNVICNYYDVSPIGENAVVAVGPALISYFFECDRLIVYASQLFDPIVNWKTLDYDTAENDTACESFLWILDYYSSRKTESFNIFFSQWNIL